MTLVKDTQPCWKTEAGRLEQIQKGPRERLRWSQPRRGCGEMVGTTGEHGTDGVPAETVRMYPAVWLLVRTVISALWTVSHPWKFQYCSTTETLPGGPHSRVTAFLTNSPETTPESHWQGKFLNSDVLVMAPHHHTPLPPGTWGMSGLGSSSQRSPPTFWDHHSLLSHSWEMAFLLSDLFLKSVPVM